MQLRRGVNPCKLLRIPVRLVLFLCSFVFATTVFVAWQFGASSCPLTSSSSTKQGGGMWSMW